MSQNVSSECSLNISLKHFRVQLPRSLYLGDSGSGDGAEGGGGIGNMLQFLGGGDDGDHGGFYHDV